MWLLSAHEGGRDGPGCPDGSSRTHARSMRTAPPVVVPPEHIIFTGTLDLSQPGIGFNLTHEKRARMRRALRFGAIA